MVVMTFYLITPHVLGMIIQVQCDMRVPDAIILSDASAHRPWGRLAIMLLGCGISSGLCPGASVWIWLSPFPYISHRIDKEKGQDAHARPALCVYVSARQHQLIASFTRKPFARMQSVLVLAC